MLPTSCKAVERDLRCKLTPPVGSKWCSRHEELQAKSLKTYKRFSFELEAYEECQVSIAYIKSCQCPEELHEISDCIRKKWVLTQRTVDARVKHHRLFYAGGDVSHQAFIDKLTKQKTVLEEKLLKIDGRAYELLKENEQAGWLDHQLPIDPICDEPATTFTAVLTSEAAPSTKSTSSASSQASDDDVSPMAQDDTAQDVFSDIETRSATSSNSCTSPCCKPVGEPPFTFRGRVLAYLDFPTSFADDDDKRFATTYIDNIFRYVISRIPSFLVRAKSVNCPSIKCFLESGDLQEAEFQRLWRGLKYNNVNVEGKVSVNVIRNAIYDAEAILVDRSGPCIDLLGGKVWKDASLCDLSRRAWDHFYRFTSCSGCALSVTYSFEHWCTNRLFAQPGYRYPAWIDEQEGPAERKLHSYGAIICGSYRKGRIGSMEHVKPKKKGMRSVWIERESRNWCFIRIMPSEDNQKRILQLDSPTLAVYTWPHQERSNDRSDSVTWVSRLRSGYNATDRRSARWTIEAGFHHTDKTHERLLSTSPEAYFHQGKPFAGPSLDVLVIDTGNEQNFDRFLLSIVNRLAKSAADCVSGNSEAAMPVQEPPILDRALFLARNMFREQS